jgi:hypothetical protein
MASEGENMLARFAEMLQSNNTTPVQQIDVKVEQRLGPIEGRLTNVEGQLQATALVTARLEKEVDGLKANATSQGLLSESASTYASTSDHVPKFIRVLVCPFPKAHEHGLDENGVVAAFKALQDSLPEHLKPIVRQPTVYGSEISKFQVFLNPGAGDVAEEVIAIWRSAAEAGRVPLRGWKANFFPEESPQDTKLNGFFGRLCGFVDNHVKNLSNCTTYNLKKEWFPEHRITVSMTDSSGRTFATRVCKLEGATVIWGERFLSTVLKTDAQSASTMASLYRRGRDL